MELVVEVIDAHDLMPKDGLGSASPFVEADFQNQLSRTKTAMATSDATSFSYKFNNLIYQGDAHCPPGSAYLHLTKTNSAGSPLPHSTGRVRHPTPVQFWRPGAQANFETTVKFVIRPPKTGNLIPADGLVFFIGPVGHSFPTTDKGGNLGIFDSYGKSPRVFSVEFDIFANEWDPNFPHVGINIESRASQSVAQIPKSFIGKEVTLSVNYVAATRVISAVATAGSQRVETSHEYDLSKILPQQVQVGLAASSGQCAATHEVAAWDFTSTFA